MLCSSGLCLPQNKKSNIYTYLVPAHTSQQGLEEAIKNYDTMVLHQHVPLHSADTETHGCRQRE